MSVKENSESEKMEIISFVGKVSSSGNRKLINIPKDKISEIPKSIENFKVYLVPILLDDFEIE